MKIDKYTFQVSANYVEPDICIVEVTSKEAKDPKKDANEKVHPDFNVFMMYHVSVNEEVIDSSIKRFDEETLSKIKLTF